MTRASGRVERVLETGSRERASVRERVVAEGVLGRVVPPYAVERRVRSTGSADAASWRRRLACGELEPGSRAKARGCALGRLTLQNLSESSTCLRPLADQGSTASAESSADGKTTGEEDTSGAPKPAEFTRSRGKASRPTGHDPSEWHSLLVAGRFAGHRVLFSDTPYALRGQGALTRARKVTKHQRYAPTKASGRNARCGGELAEATVRRETGSLAKCGNTRRSEPRRGVLSF